VKRRAAHARNLWGATLGALYRLEVYGRDYATSATVMCFADQGPLTVPALRAALPRPVQVLGVDIDGPRPGIAAAQTGLDALAAGEFVAGEAHNPVLAYLVARTGADVCPATVFGAHGRIPTDPPRPGQRIGAYIGAPVSMPRRACNVNGVHAAREQLRQVLADHVRIAEARRGAA
jgi:hypothetical protein